TNTAVSFHPTTIRSTTTSTPFDVRPTARVSSTTNISRATSAAPTTRKTSALMSATIRTPARITLGCARGAWAARPTFGAASRSDYDFKAHDRDGFGENWPISYSDLSPYYDKVDLYLGVTGVKEGLEWLPDSIFQRPTKLNCAEVTLKTALKSKLDRTLTQYRA